MTGWGLLGAAVGFLFAGLAGAAIGFIVGVVALHLYAESLEQ